jgi:hypothetical protein
MARIKPGFMAAVRHVDESSSGQVTDSRKRDSRRRSGDANARAGVISIGDGVRMGGEYGVSASVKKPDWLRSMTESLWEDTNIDTRFTRSRDTSASRGAASAGARGPSRDLERGKAGSAAPLPHAGQPRALGGRKEW